MSSAPVLATLFALLALPSVVIGRAARLRWRSTRVVKRREQRTFEQALLAENARLRAAVEKLHLTARLAVATGDPAATAVMLETLDDVLGVTRRGQAGARDQIGA